MTNKLIEAVEALPQFEYWGPNAAATVVVPLSDVRRLARQHAQQGMVEALTPSPATKAAYAGEFHFPLAGTDENGVEVSMLIGVPWKTIKEIMAAIRDRAGIPTPPPAARVSEAGLGSPARYTDGTYSREYDEAHPLPSTELVAKVQFIVRAEMDRHPACRTAGVVEKCHEILAVLREPARG